MSKKNINDIPNSCKIATALIVELCEAEFEIEKKDIMGSSRREELVIIRAMCYYILCKIAKFKPSDVSGIFGKDHATILHGIRIHKNTIDTNFGGYGDRYFKVLALYKMMTETKDNVNPFYQIINEIDKKRTELFKLKDALVLSYLTNSILDSKTLEMINEIFPENDKRRVIEKNIANGIRIG